MINFVDNIVMNLLSLCLSFISVFASTPATYQVCASECYVYEEPSFESEIVMFENEELVLKHGQEVTLLVEGERFSYVEVQDDVYGYVYNYYLSPVGGQEIYPAFNGFVRTDGAVIYDMNFADSGFVARSGQEIYLYNGYYSSETYTAIQIVLEDGSLYNGYMLTADIEPQGISASLIVGITIIVAIVTIVLSLLFIKKKKKKKSGSEN